MKPQSGQAVQLSTKTHQGQQINSSTSQNRFSYKNSPTNKKPLSVQNSKLDKSQNLEIALESPKLKNCSSNVSSAQKSDKSGERAQKTGQQKTQAQTPSSRKPSGRTLAESGRLSSQVTTQSRVSVVQSPKASPQTVQTDIAQYVKALQNKDVATIRRFSIQKKFILNQWTSLMLIIPSRNDELFSYFYKESSMASPQGLTPLMIASYHGVDKFVDQLSRDCNFALLEPTYNCFAKEQAIHIALRRGQFRVAHILLQKTGTCGLTADFIRAAAGRSFRFEASVDCLGRTQLMYCAMQSQDYGVSSPVSPTGSVSQLFSETSARVQTKERQCDFESLAQQQGLLDDNSLSALMYAVIYKNMAFINYAVDNSSHEIGLRTIDDVKLVLQDSPFDQERIVQIPAGSTSLVIALILGRDDAAFALRTVESQYLTQDGRSWNDFCEIAERQDCVSYLAFNRRLAIENNRRACQKLIALESYAVADSRLEKKSTNSQIAEMCQILGCQCNQLIDSIKTQHVQYQEVYAQQQAAQLIQDAQQRQILERTEELNRTQRNLVQNDELAAELRHQIINLNTRQFSNKSEQICPESQNAEAEVNTKGNQSYEMKEMQTVDTCYNDNEQQTIISMEQMQEMGRFMLTIRRRIERVQNLIQATFRRLKADREAYKATIATYSQRLNQIDNLSFQQRDLSESGQINGNIVVSVAQFVKQQKTVLELEREVDALLRENSKMRKRISRHELALESVRIEAHQ